MSRDRPLTILALVHRVPYPPNKGEKIRAFFELQHLGAQGHRIDLCTFADVEEDLRWGPELSAICRRVKIVPKDRRLGKVRSLLSLPRRHPLSVGYFHSFRFERTVRRWLNAERYDLAFCYSSPMAEYVRKARSPKMVRVMDFVDVDSDKWRQYAAHVSQPMRSVYQFEAGRLERYERSVAEEFELSTLVSAAEAEQFRRVAPKAQRIESVPNGVDTDFFGQTARRPAPESAPLLVFVGQMDYFANIDGVKYFAEEVLPRVRRLRPEARFQIVGRAPTTEVKKLGELPGVEVTGAVDDVRTYLASATLMVAPLRIARGIQNKVLEAMAARVPIVASPAAFEGIEGKDGEEALIAASPEAFAGQIERALLQPSLCAALVQRAERLVKERYAWATAMGKLESLMREEVARRESSA